MNSNRKIADRIRGEKYRVFSKELAHLIGLQESIYLMYLVDQDNYFNGENIGQPFFKQQYYIFYETTLSYETIRKINNKFINMNLIKIIKKGLPAKNYFEINYEEVDKLLDESLINFDRIKKEFLENNLTSSSQNIRELEPKELGNINNKEENNNNSNILLHKISDESKDSSLNEKELELVNIIKMNDEGSIEFLVEEELNIPIAPPPVEEEPKKKKGGIAPLLDIIDNKYPKSIYEELNQLLKAYIKSHIGIRKIPSIEKWNEMLIQLDNYSSIKLPGASGQKLNKQIAARIVEKALNGKDGIPFLEFDDLFGYGKEKSNVMEPQIKNQEIKKGY